MRDIERIIVENIRGRGNRRWQEVQGAFVMFPPDKVAAKVSHVLPPRVPGDACHVPCVDSRGGGHPEP